MVPVDLEILVVSISAAVFRRKSVVESVLLMIRIKLCLKINSAQKVVNKDIFET